MGKLATADAAATGPTFVKRRMASSSSLRSGVMLAMWAWMTTLAAWAAAQWAWVTAVIAPASAPTVATPKPAKTKQQQQQQQAHDKGVADATAEALAVLDSLRSEITDDRSKERLERVSSLLKVNGAGSASGSAAGSTFASPKLQRQSLDGTTTPPRDNSASGFLKRTFSFGRLPPEPPTPPSADLPRVPPKPFRPLRPVFKWLQTHFPDAHWAITSYRKVESQPPAPGERTQIKIALLRSPQVQSAIKVSAEVNGITPEQATRNAERIFETMAADMWVPAVRFVGYLVRKALKLFYPFGMDVGGSEIQRVREASRKGPLLLLPSHKSYLDFLIVSYICFQYKLPLPHVVSGDNLNFPLVGPFLRWGGAFFIQRTFSSSDPLYRTIFNEYIAQLLSRGHSVECFIEGGRSRIGKVLPPKVGFMRGVLDAVIDRQIGDVYLVPISLGYDRLIENDTYIKELTGGKKRAERLVSFLRNCSQLLLSTYRRTLNFGKINVGIGEPISLHHYLTTTLASLPESAGGPVVAPAASPAPTVASFTSESVDDAAGVHVSNGVSAHHDDETATGINGAAEEAVAMLMSPKAAPAIARVAAVAKDSPIDSPSTPASTPITNGVVNILSNKPLTRTKAPQMTMVTHSLPIMSTSHASHTAPANTLAPGNLISPAARKYLTNAVGYRILYDINHATTLLPTALVGTILFTQYGRGIRDSELVKKIKWLRRQLIIRGGRVQMMHEDGLHEHVMAVVNQVLKGNSKVNDNTLVKRHKDILMLSVYSPAERMELSLYRNQLIHLFVQEGILLCAFYACEMLKNTYPAYVDKEELTKACQYLSQLLKLEFIFKPSPGIEVTIDEVIHFLLQHGIVQESKDEIESGKTVLKYCVNEQLGIDGEYQGTYTYLFVCSLFWPFIDSYYLVALSCYRLLPDRMLEEESLIRWVQALGEALYFEGLLDLYEAISSVTLANGLTLLENWGVIKFVSIETDSVSFTGRTAGKRIVQLTSAYHNEKQLEEVVLKMGQFRKRLAAYRSRRYRSRVNNQHADAINVVKRLDVSSAGKIVK